MEAVHGWVWIFSGIAHLAAGIFASRRESWRDLKNDPGEILAAGNFASRRDSRREEKSVRPKSRRDPGGIPAEILAGSRQDHDPYFTRVTAPKLWNKLPLDLRSLDTINLFKKHLKTDLFKKAFNV